jgi:AcrR family transcriptional regulator
MWWTPLPQKLQHVLLLAPVKRNSSAAVVAYDHPHMNGRRTVSPTGQPSTPRQFARRDGAIRAALELGTEGGYDAVRMRDVAERADIALGTLYRYFGSKDHLLSCAMAFWAADLRGRLTKRPARGESPVEQVVDVLGRASSSLEHQPRLGEALVKAIGSHDPGVAEASGEVSTHIRAMLEPLLLDLDHDVRDGLIDLIAQVWHSSLMGWANGRFPIHDVGVKMERAVRLILEPRFEPVRIPVPTVVAR